MIQIYCDGEKGVNEWLRENQNVEIIDLKMSLNELGELIMVVYKINE